MPKKYNEYPPADKKKYNKIPSKKYQKPDERKYRSYPLTGKPKQDYELFTEYPDQTLAEYNSIEVGLLNRCQKAERPKFKRKMCASAVQNVLIHS